MTSMRSTSRRCRGMAPTASSSPTRVPPRQALAVDPRVGGSGLALTVLGPHPARGPILFRIDVPARMHVRLAVFDVAGRRVGTLVGEEVAAGAREVRWDGRNARGEGFRGGIYFARLASAGGQRVARVVLLR